MASAASSEDPSASGLTYLWELTEPDGSVVVPVNSLENVMSFSPDIEGVYTLRLTVDDGDNADVASTTVTVSQRRESDPKFTVNSTGNAVQNWVPMTFGQVFAQGRVANTDNLRAVMDDASMSFDLQMDAKTAWPDGSVKHAIVSGVMPSLDVASSRTFSIDSFGNPLGEAILLSDVLAGGFDATVEIILEGAVYTASAAELFNREAPKQWLAGAVASEWRVLSSLQDSDGNAHPHLAVQFNVRAFQGLNNIRVDFVIENNWTYEDDPSNHRYDVALTINGRDVYTKNDQIHFHHARWRKTFWSNDEPQMHIALNPVQFMSTKVMPNYDASLLNNIDETTLQNYGNTWQSTETTLYVPFTNNTLGFTLDGFGPMGNGLANTYMPSTGGREDIGPFPTWGAAYFLSQDARAKAATLGSGDLAGSWPIHYRDKNTGEPVSIQDYPAVNTEYTSPNPVTGLSERVALCSVNCGTPYYPDNAHQPSFAYLPYLVTGDYYYLEELLFWTNWSVLNQNPPYRDYQDGVVTGQVRSLAWVLRKMGQSADIIPDNHAMHDYFNTMLSKNLDYYINNYVVANPNDYGALRPGYSYPVLSPWMDDFFTWSIGYVTDLGFSEAKPILDWKAKFPVKRMGFTNGSDDDFCWIFASSYRLKIAPDVGADWYTDIADAYDATNGIVLGSDGLQFDDQGTDCASQEMATLIGLQQGEMIRWSGVAFGNPSVLQIALAASVDSGISGALDAWVRFSNRNVQPDYTINPAYAIVPR